MSRPVSFDRLLVALQESVADARKALQPASPRIEELTIDIEGTLYESPAGLGFRLGRRWMWRRGARQRLQIRLRGEPIVTEVSIDGHSLEQDDETNP